MTIEQTELFTADEIAQIKGHGLTVERAEQQIGFLRKPPASVRLVRPCTIGDGITQLSGEDQELLERAGEAAAEEGRITRFIPASGAATRMFKDLVAALEGRSFDRVRTFFERLDEFPFSEELKANAGSRDEESLLRTLLYDMNFAQKPKGLIPFHRDEDGVHTAFEEQLREACGAIRDDDGACRIHFTVSPDFLHDFDVELERVAPLIGDDTGCSFEVEFSIQYLATDTLATDHDGHPFRTNGKLLFRPGGHGALLRNLQDVAGDIVSIKNIDNVLPAGRNAEAIRWKKILAGLLARIQEETFAVLRACDDEQATTDVLQQGVRLAERYFSRLPQQQLHDREAMRSFVMTALDRPLRVCGVVRNEGEPGGAPFWATHEGTEESIQIVESSQVRFDDPEQKRIWESSTHFNPVDITCGVRDFRGEPFDLQKFVDERAVFVATKSHEGRELHALELPGLWNGAMAGWNTICVEVPASTFAPVKTVFDLLRPEHAG